MDEYIEEFILYLCEVREKAGNTGLCYKRDLLQFAAYCRGMGIHTPGEITPVLLNSYILFMESSGKKPTTVSRSVTSIRAFFQYLMDVRVSDTNPALNLKAPKIHKKSGAVLPQEIMERFFGQLSGTSPKELRDRAMLELLHTTGIRACELLSLRLSDLNMQLDFIVCREGQQERVIPFDKRTREALERYLARGRSCFAKEGEETLLFTNYAGGAMSRQGFWKLVKSYGKKAGIEERLTVCALRQRCREE